MADIDFEHPLKTKFLRVPASGPKPCNTFAFLRCSGGGAGVALRTDKPHLQTYSTHFKSEFKIDGYTQGQSNFYHENTFISATVFVRQFQLELDDASFIMAVNSVTPWLDDSDGSIGFDCELASFVDDTNTSVVFAFEISAYVLLYEPRVEMPPSGNSSGQWRIPSKSSFQPHGRISQRDQIWNQPGPGPKKL
jgi:hypothetical protein